VGLRRCQPRGPRAPGADDRDLPAAGPRAGSAADLAADAAAAATGDPRAHPRPGPYTRLDTSALGDPAQRPTNWDYDRYLWLVELLREYRYDDEQIHRHCPFQIKDVFFSAVLVAANAALLDLADAAGAGAGDRDEVAGWLDRGRAGLARQFDDAGQRAAQLRLLDSADFCGNPRLRWPLLPSTSPAEPAFEPHNYWRGPVWPVIDWLLWQSLTELGCADRAAGLRRDSLAQVGGAGEFNEYFDPFTGAPLGSPRQSWTAAVVLDWAAPPP
jgi:hypothetical protein